MARNLISESARLTAKLEGEHHLEALRRDGLLSLRRPVRILGRPLIGADAPKAGEKVVHLIRHGQGFHNLFGDLWKDFGQAVDITKPDNPYNRPEVLDPPLTTIGRQQAQGLQPHTRTLSGTQLVVVSPMRRAVETSILAFAHAVPGVGQKGVPFLGREDCHEEVHANICDKRRPLTEIKAEFPMVDWSEVLDEEDPLWNDGAKEPTLSVAERGYNFMLWLRDRPETEVAVGTHSAWLFTLLNAVIECSDPELSQWFQTGELRSVVLSWSSEDSDEHSTKRAKVE